MGFFEEMNFFEGDGGEEGGRVLVSTVEVKASYLEILDFAYDLKFKFEPVVTLHKGDDTYCHNFCHVTPV